MESHNGRPPALLPGMVLLVEEGSTSKGLAARRAGPRRVSVCNPHIQDRKSQAFPAGRETSVEWCWLPMIRKPQYDFHLHQNPRRDPALISLTAQEGRHRCWEKGISARIATRLQGFVQALVFCSASPGCAPWPTPTQLCRPRARSISRRGCTAYEFRTLA